MDEWNRGGQMWALDYLEATADEQPREANLGQHAQLLVLRDVDGRLDEQAVMKMLMGMANVADWALRNLAKRESGTEDTRQVIARVRKLVEQSAVE